MEARGFGDELDELALTRLRRGCRKTQERVYRRYAGPVWNLAVRLSGCEARAWDAVQEAFLAAFRRIGQFRGPQGFGFWLRRILVNQVMDQHRKSARETTLPDSDPDPAAEPDPRWLDLESALARLEETDRLVVWLYDVEGMTHAEIAEATGQTVPWSKTRLSRSRAKLRELLGTGETESMEAKSGHG